MLWECTPAHPCPFCHLARRGVLGNARGRCCWIRKCEYLSYVPNRAREGITGSGQVGHVNTRVPEQYQSVLELDREIWMPSSNGKGATYISSIIKCSVIRTLNRSCCCCYEAPRRVCGPFFPFSLLPHRTSTTVRGRSVHNTYRVKGECVVLYGRFGQCIWAGELCVFFFVSSFYITDLGVEVLSANYRRGLEFRLQFCDLML